VYIANGIEKQIAATKKLIAANKNSTDLQIAANEELIATNEKIAAETIKASKTRIESILLKFVND
jgi:hypothetical protein